MVQVTHGVRSNLFDVAGQTIGNVRANFGALYGIPNGAVALVFGDLVGDEHILEEGDELDFVVEVGRKGVGRVWTDEQLADHFGVATDTLDLWEQQGCGLFRAADGTRRWTETGLDDFARRLRTLQPDRILWDGELSPSSKLLTEEEAIRYLRLDTINITHPAATLRRYREMGLLRGTQISKRVFFLRDELDRLLVRLTEENPR